MWNLPFDMYEGPVKELLDGQEIRLREDLLQVYFTPGHSPGHVVFHCAAQQFVIGGDVLFRGSIGRTDLPGGDYDTLLMSIETKLMTLPDTTSVYSGHGPVTTIGDERATNPFLNTSR
jgi:hydroxyacylglutathione hydrolase